MVVLGGWLFADLLLGLAMLFFTANTVGSPAPTPTPSATPNLLETAQASHRALATRAARDATVAAGTAQAMRAQADARETEVAVTAAAQATVVAQSTAAAGAAGATIAAQSTADAASAA